MGIDIFGATARTGRHLIDGALEVRHESTGVSPGYAKDAGRA
jgi:hypothetical protein